MDNLNPFDIVVLAILVLSAFWGGMRGVVAQIATIASWVVSWFVAARYYSVLERFISESNEWRTPIAAVITFAVCSIAISIAASFLKKFISLAGIKEVDRQAGALFGIVKGALFCLLITFFAVIATDKTRDLVNASKSGPFFISIIGEFQDKLPDSTIKTKFQSLIAENKEKESESNSVESTIESLKTHLEKSVLTESAQNFVEEADKSEGTDSSKQSNSFLSFLSGLKSMSDGIASWKNGESEKVESQSSSQEQTTPLQTTSSSTTDEKQTYSSYGVSNSYGSSQAYGGTNDGSSSAYVETPDNLSSFVQTLTDSPSYQNSYGSTSANSSSTYDYSGNQYSNNSQYANYSGTNSGFTPYSGNTSYNSYGNANTSASYSNDLSNNGDEFGFRTQSTSTRDSSLRRRSSSRSASSARLGSYSYSSNY